MKDGTHHHGPLAGLGAGAAAVLFAFGVLAMAWHRVAGQVSMAVAFVAYAVMACMVLVVAAGTWLVVLWVLRRHRNPHLLDGRRRAVQAEVAAAPAAPDALPYAQPAAAIEPPRVYFTDDQFAALMRQQVTVTQLPRDSHDREPG